MSTDIPGRGDTTDHIAVPVPGSADLLGLELRWQAASFAVNGLTVSHGLCMIAGY